MNTGESYFKNRLICYAETHALIEKNFYTTRLQRTAQFVSLRLNF